MIPLTHDKQYRLVCDAEYRLGRLGVQEIKAHPFFYGVNWDTLRSEPSPYVPQLSSITDTSHFPTEELDAIPEAVDAHHMPQGKVVYKYIIYVAHRLFSYPDYATDTVNAQKDLAFVGYTFKRFDNLTRKNIL